MGVVHHVDVQISFQMTTKPNYGGQTWSSFFTGGQCGPAQLANQKNIRCFGGCFPFFGGGEIDHLTNSYMLICMFCMFYWGFTNGLKS